MNQAPRVNFSHISLSQEVSLFYEFLFEDDWGWTRYIFRKHPGLKPVMDLQTRMERRRCLREYIRQYHEENERLVEEKTEWMKTTWQEVEDRCLCLLSEILETAWPAHRTRITALISLNPICPRFLATWSFTVFLNYRKRAHLLEVIMHEICHFLYFKKWSEVFSNADPKTYETPYLEWHLSELLAPVILNDTRVQKVLRRKADFYEEHQKIMIGGRSAPAYFTDLYTQTIKEGQPFDQFPRDAYTDIKKHRSAFEKAGTK